jgi:phosphotransferase system HPr (HPr) family protein
MTINQKIMIKDPSGLHLRVAVQFLTKIKIFKSQIWVQKDDMRVDAKSVLNLVQLGAPAGTELDFFLEGDDADEAMESIKVFFNHSD